MKKILLCSLLLASGFVFAGCGSSNGDSTTIKWAVWDVKKESVEHDLVKAFEKEHPDIEIELTNIASADYQDKITTMLAAGNTTDVITMKNARQYVALAYSGALMDLTDHLSANENVAKAESAFDSLYTEEGKIYAEPIKADSWYLFYNKDLFDQKGVAYPENITWDEYASIAKQLTDSDEKVFGSYQVVWPSVVQAPAYAQSDIDYANPDYEWLRSFYETALDLQDQGYAQSFATNSASSEAAGYETAFENEQAGMLIMGTWYVPTLIASSLAGDTDVNWGLAQLPQQRDAEGIQTASAITGVAVNNNSRHKSDSQKFVDFLASEEAAQIYAKKGVFPAIASETVTNNLLSIEGMATDDLTKQTLNAEKQLKGELPISKKTSSVNTILEETHSMIMNEEITLDEAIDEMNHRVADLEK